jgi:type II secretion system protein G
MSNKAQGPGRGDEGTGIPCPLPLAPCPSRKAGFTLIELLVVLAIIGTLLALAAPRYFQHVQRGKEAVLRENLATMRDAIDQYHADKGQWPESLAVLAETRYLRRVPPDPITERTDTWVELPPAEPEATGVQDVKSGAEGQGLDGTPYTDW